MKEFWNEEIIKKSWDMLVELNKKFNFVVIGGWAVYLWTKAYKSKDIDIVLDFDELDKIKKEFILEKNIKLKKFEIKQEFFDIDIYVPYFSNFLYPIEKLFDNYRVVEGFKVPPIEVLIILKQQALIERKGIKAKKDSYDIMLLLMKGANLKKYVKLIKETKRPELIDMLINIVRRIALTEHYYFNLDFKKFSEVKKNIIKKLIESKKFL